MTAVPEEMELEDGGETGDGGIGAGGDVGVGVERSEREDFEIIGGYRAEVVEVVVVPAIVGCAGDVHRRTVVGEDEAVLFHGVEDDLISGRIAGDIEAGFEAEARAHGERVGVAGGGSEVRSGRNETGAGILQRETNGVMDGACGDFIVTN